MFQNTMFRGYTCYQVKYYADTPGVVPQNETVQLDMGSLFNCSKKLLRILFLIIGFSSF